MPEDSNPKRISLKRGDLQVRTRGDLTTILWRDKCDVCILTKIHDAPAEGNFCDTDGKAIYSHKLWWSISTTWDM
jgi:hypothetical protein